MRLLKLVPFVCLSFSSLMNCYCDERSLELVEHETLAYSAMIANSVADVSNIANEAVLTCYNAYKSHYDWEAAKVKEKYGSPSRSSGAQLAIIQVTKTFANQIISQIDSLARQLTPQQRQQFWTVAESKIKSVLQPFCLSHGCSSTGDLNQYITDQINLKKKFG